MKLLYNGIHKNIGFTIQHCGGYDKEYHITKLAEKLNINRADVDRLFKESSRKNLYHYIELLDNGMRIEKVFEMMEIDNRISRRKINTSLAMMSGMILTSPYRNLL